MSADPGVPDSSEGMVPLREGSGTREGKEEARFERLEALAGVEAWRARLEASLAPDPERVARGWERRFVADGDRAKEMMALYRELGFEVVADPVDPGELDEGCRDCALVAALRFRTIYTRRPGTQDRDLS